MTTQKSFSFNIHIIDKTHKNWPDSNKIMQLSPLLQFSIDYPLNKPKSIDVVHHDGSAWTQKQFVDEVCKQYKEVYAEEDAAVGDPGHIDGMLNRQQSNGPHGIWGHDIGDLYLEGTTQLKNGKWDLGVGS